MSAIGHEPTAHMLSERLGVTVKACRIKVRLADYAGIVLAEPREQLPSEGQVLSTEDVEGTTFVYWLVRRASIDEILHAKTGAVRPLFEK